MNVRGFVTVANTGSVCRLVGGLCVWLAIIAGSAVAQTGGWRDSHGRTKGNGTDARQIRPGIQAFIPGVDRVADAEEPDMAETYWNSSGSAAWNLAANWTGGVPGAADTAIFDGRSQVSVAGADRSAGGTLTRIRVHPEYRGDIGSADGPLIIPVNYVDYRGTGQAYIQQTLTLKTLFVNSARPLGSNAMHWTGNSPKLMDVLAGQVLLNAADGASGPTSLVVVGGFVRIGAENKTTGWLTLYGGEVVIEANVSGIYVDGGRLTDRGTTGTAIVVSGGEYIADNDPTTGSYAYAIRGVFDIKRCTSAYSMAHLSVYPGADFRHNAESLAAITVLRDLRSDFP